jgi:hypothetical protein
MFVVIVAQLALLISVSQAIFAENVLVKVYQFAETGGGNVYLTVVKIRGQVT